MANLQLKHYIKLVGVSSKRDQNTHSGGLQIKAIFNNYWMRLSKIWWFVSGKQINSLLKLKQIIDFQDTDESPYFVITELENYFIIQSPNLLSYFNHALIAWGSQLPFFPWEYGFNYTWAEYYLQQNSLFRQYYAWADHYFRTQSWYLALGKLVNFKCTNFRCRARATCKNFRSTASITGSTYSPRGAFTLALFCNMGPQCTLEVLNTINTNKRIKIFHTRVTLRY